jgi:hypothetical protein
MIACVTDATGQIVAVHRTYLCRDGTGKAGLKPQRASLGPIWHGAVRLDPVSGDAELVVAEGIETAASAGCLTDLPARAAISAGNLGKGLLLPPQVRRVVIAADPDDTGRDAAREAWFRWWAEGRAVRIAMPNHDGCDSNDLLVARYTHGMV